MRYDTFGEMGGVPGDGDERGKLLCVSPSTVDYAVIPAGSASHSEGR